LLDLTTFQDCLVCGAYEAMTTGKPCVLSDTPALREYFTRGVVFTSHEPTAIARAVQDAYDKRQALHEEIATWRDTNQAHIATRIAALRDALGLASRAP
jgi:glycosyltransferase involved in cell wall biosynthesis